MADMVGSHGIRRNGLNEHVGQMGDGGQVSNWTDVIMVI